MKRFSSPAFCWLVEAGAVILLALLLVPVAKAGPDERLAGHYEYAGAPGLKQIVLDLTVGKDEGGIFTVELGAAHTDGSGAAPEGSGKGKVDAEGTLRFDFEDSFENRGTGIFLRVGPGEFKLNVSIKEVKDARCLQFYGEHTLKRSRPKDQ